MIQELIKRGFSLMLNLNKTNSYELSFNFFRSTSILYFKQDFSIWISCMFFLRGETINNANRFHNDLSLGCFKAFHLNIFIFSFNPIEVFLNVEVSNEFSKSTRMLFRKLGNKIQKNLHCLIN